MRRQSDAHIPMGTLNTVRGPGQVLNMLQLASTNQQRERKQIIDHTARPKTNPLLTRRYKVQEALLRLPLDLEPTERPRPPANDPVYRLAA